MLGQIGDLKELVGIDDADVTQDTTLTLALETASVKILDYCKLVEVDTPAIVETFRNVQQGREYKTGVRNVDTSTNAFLVEGRGQGAGIGFAQLAADLIDPVEGVWMILGSADWWPPVYATENRRERFRRWREPTWPVVRVTYDATGVGDSNARLTTAATSLASYWLSQAKAGAVTQVTLGQLAQEIEREAMPSHIPSMLGNQYRGSGARWVR